MNRPFFLTRTVKQASVCHSERRAKPVVEVLLRE